MNNTIRKVKGFTLIELLVVISIIGLLSSIMLVSIATARAKARDARRISDLKQMVNSISQLGEGAPFVGVGCTGAGVKRASSCTSPLLTGLNDPTAGPTGAVCGTGALSATCDYRVQRRTANDTPMVNDFQICAYLEQPSNFRTTAGVVRITDQSNYTIQDGGATGCTF